ncbi:hypothetical protein EKO27_g4417 [Xylaria grammica]|uniref:DUF1996 domain-containing protein n=1 Tax=Xylaria grammica TaxID=363999 RepID=A0A439D8F7_9PEZI|nr:hypothetical protein F5X98DRAFT_203163 [Xylaria grammica]RWA10692.1 hypothetical protein EKO27_g4417 [Xylaria grammica]GAW13391.1 hypothetical protein ANO14919_027760 [Xylariales sp. No.14919]
MHWKSMTALALAARTTALLRFSCTQLTIDRVDPLVNPGLTPSPHLHQIIGGNSFNVTMDPAKDMPGESSCTTCQFLEDSSNYWTAVLFFRARNGTYKRVPIVPNVGFEGAEGGMTVYYMQNGLADYQQTSKVTAFKPGFRMIIGDPLTHTAADSNRFRQVTFTCLQDPGTRFPETKNFPNKPCPAGIMANIRFPTCWDGKNLDTQNHMDHMAYPANGTFDSRGPCPASHPVPVPQLMYETVWDTRQFNNPEDWPEDGSQPFVWSFGDQTGYGSHGDYLFGWQGDALQKTMDTPCYVNCPTLTTQPVADQNKCKVAQSFKEDIDNWLPELPGNPVVSKRWAEKH